MESSELVDIIKSNDTPPLAPLPKIERQLPLRAPIERITSQDLLAAAELPNPGETLMVLQRNIKDDRNRDSSDIGALESASKEKTRGEVRTVFKKMLDGRSEEEAKSVDVLVVASAVQLRTPDGIVSAHRRGVETADEVIDVLSEFSLSNGQVLNNSAANGKPVELSTLIDLKMLSESPEFENFLKQKYGDGIDFWAAYEDDREKETRVRMGAEGPGEIADRIGYFMSVMNTAANEYHKSHPERRLIIWGVSHYDALSPYIKEHVAGIDQKEYLPVDYGAGIAVHAGENGATANIHGQSYTVKL